MLEDHDNLRSAAERATDLILPDLARGVLPWASLYTIDGGGAALRPYVYNEATGCPTPLTGINVFLLSIARLKCRFDSNVWIEPGAICRLGGNVSGSGRKKYCAAKTAHGKSRSANARAPESSNGWKL